MGKVGTAGAISPRTQATISDVAALATPAFTGMLVDACARDLISRTPEDNRDPATGAVPRLLWLRDFVGSLAALPEGQRPPAADLERYASQAKTLASMLNNLNLGLDYFGHPPNYVSLISVETYRDFMKDLLDNAEKIETAYLAYSEENANNQTAIDSLVSARENASVLIQKVRDHQASLAAQEGDCEATIERLARALNETWVELMKAEAAFRSDVEKQGPGCGFAQLLAVASSVATVVATAGAAAPAVVAGLSALQNAPMAFPDGKPVKDDFAGFKYKVGTVVAAGESIGSFVKAFEQVKDKLAPGRDESTDLPTLPGDEAKIVASAKDIEEQLKPFLKMESAREYKDLLEQFVAIAEAKNNKIIEYCQARSEWRRAEGDVEQLQIKADKAQNEIAGSANPYFAEAANFMNRAWLRTKTDLVRTIRQVESANNFYALTAAKRPLNDLSMKTLRAAWHDVLQDYVKQMDAYSSDPAHLSKQIDITPYVSKSAFRAFQKTGRITFSLPSTEAELKNYSNVVATKVWIRLEAPSGRTPQALQVTLAHEGRAVMFDQGGALHTFSHAPIYVPYEIKAGGAATNADGLVSKEVTRYVGVSPYGPWTIQVNDIDAGFLTQVVRLTFHFEGKGRARQI